MAPQEREIQEGFLLAAIIRELPRLEELWRDVGNGQSYEDLVYRFYHQSMKVFHLQECTEQIVEKLRGIARHLPLNSWFTAIVALGTGKVFSSEMNGQWTETTRPIVEAFFHARYFLEMVCKCGRELKKPPTPLPSGWAAVLELYQIR